MVLYRFYWNREVPKFNIPQSITPSRHLVCLRVSWSQFGYYIKLIWGHSEDIPPLTNSTSSLLQEILETYNSPIPLPLSTHHHIFSPCLPPPVPINTLVLSSEPFGINSYPRTTDLNLIQVIFLFVCKTDFDSLLITAHVPPKTIFQASCKSNVAICWWL